MHGIKCIIILVALIVGCQGAGAQSFIENRGQWDAPFLFKMEYRSAVVYLREDGLRFHLQDPGAMSHVHDNDGGHHMPEGPIQNHAFDVVFNGTPSHIQGKKQRVTYHNYYLGKNKNRWKNKVSLYGEVEYQNLYPGVDLVLESGLANMKYNLYVAPNANSNQIKWSYVGAEELYLENNRLIIVTSVGRLVEESPKAWQIIDGTYKKVEVRFILEGNNIAFELGEYDQNHQLIIDPNYIFSSYTGSTADNFGYTATYDLNGNTYGGGIVFANGYPTSTGAFQTTFAGGTFDCSISKFSSDGTQLLFSTYLGGTSNEQPHSMVVDSQGHLIILGVTGSANFPVTASAYDTSYNGGPSINVGWAPFAQGVDMFFAKFSAGGDSLLASTFLGGTGVDGTNYFLQHNYGDASRGEVVVDSIGNIYFSSSTNSVDFPTSTNAFIDTLGGTQDAVIGKFNTDLSLLNWSTYLGGTNVDAGYSLKLNWTQDRLYTTGGTKSADFPVDPGAYQSSILGGTEGWITSFNPINGAFVNSTFNGTSKYDQNFFVTLDIEDAVYVFGQTKGNYPISAGAWSIPHSSQYIHKFHPNLNQSLRSTVFGSGDSIYVNISPTALMVDLCKSVYISGWGGNTNTEGSTVGMPITSNAYDTVTDGSDFYFLVLDGSWKFIEYGSYFGGQGSNEHVDGGTSRFSPEGIIYQAVCAGCGGTSLFPTFPSNVYSSTNNSFNCNMACMRVDFDLDSANVNIELIPDSTCAPHNLTFIDLSTNVDVMHWDFGDGTTFTGRKPNKTFDSAGVYVIEIVGIDTLCNTTDTDYVTLFVVETLIEAKFTADWDTCDVPYQVRLTNQSFGKVFIWLFGDGTTSSATNPVKNYSNAGTYIVKLAVQDTFCGKWDTASATIFFRASGGQISFTTRYDPCVSWSNVTFIASANSYFHVYEWSTGDGESGFGPYYQHTYNQPGNYTIKLTAYDTICNKTSSQEQTITVFQYEAIDEILPNVFTPNRDGANDSWKLISSVNPDQFSSFKLELFNRWGSLVFATSNPTFEWTGNFKDKELGEGVFYWVVWYEDICLNKTEEHGIVHIVR